MNRPTGNRQPQGRAPSASAAVGARGRSVPSLDEADARFLREIAERLRAAGLASAAVLWLASLRPLSFLGSQLLHVAAPLLDVLLSGRGHQRLARLLESRENLDLLLSHLEADNGPARDGTAAS